LPLTLQVNLIAACAVIAVVAFLIAGLVYFLATVED
jgi:hypothetical protein